MRFEHWFYTLPMRLRSLFRRSRVEDELDEELRYHLERQIEEDIANGMTAEEARRAALRAMDGLEQRKEECRDMRRVRFIEDLFQDFRFSLRMLSKQPIFSSASLLTLALGIGANTAIFSVINGVLLRPLGFSDPDRLVMIWTDNRAYQLGFHEFPPANSDVPEWRATTTSFEQIAICQSSLADLSDDGNPERVGGVDVSANLLPMLGAQPILGRQFSEEEERPGQDRVAVISYDLWQRRFAGNTEIVGKTLSVNGVPRTIIGVLPEGFNFPRATEMPRSYNLPEKADLWTPFARDAGYWQNRIQRQLVIVVARLKAGIAQSQAQIEMDSVAARQAAAYPESHEGWRIWLTPLFNQIVSQTRAPLLILLGAVGFLLLIACANMASLLLARSASRRREMAVRAAVGAGRGRIIRQLLTEGLVLSVLGGGLGLLAGYLGMNFLLSFMPPNVPRLQDISLDLRVLLFTGLLSIVTGVLFGLVPGWQMSKVSLAEAFKDAVSSRSAVRGIRSHSLVVTVEVALVAILLVGALLMLQSFRRLAAVDPGFSPQGVATFEVSLPRARYMDGGQRAQFFEQARLRLTNLAGVREVGAVSALPLSGNESMNWFSVEGAEPVPRGKEPLAEDRVVSPGYFSAMGVNLISGRDFDANDVTGRPLVAIINETLARRFFPGGDALGKRIRWELGEMEWKTIVGVVRDVRGFALESDSRPQVYRPHTQVQTDAMVMVLRVDKTALPHLRSAIQQEFKQLDAAIPVANFRMMPELVDRAVAKTRFTTLLLGLLALAALVLAVVGLYGVVAYGVNQRTREIGLRMALGAQPRSVLALVVRQGLQPAIVGCGIGLLGAFALMRMFANQLYEVQATDPGTFALVAAGLLPIVFAACYIPARRATKIDPMMVLRHE
ncbi:MAG TPA: ABC transporter permease [Blastocatellia bacterium]|nr:ABC transporter permease [Blastocatellia bacterium]